VPTTDNIPTDTISTKTHKWNILIAFEKKGVWRFVERRPLDLLTSKYTGWLKQLHISMLDVKVSGREKPRHGETRLGGAYEIAVGASCKTARHWAPWRASYCHVPYRAIPCLSDIVEIGDCLWKPHFWTLFITSMLRIKFSTHFLLPIPVLFTGIELLFANIGLIPKESAAI